MRRSMYFICTFTALVLALSGCGDSDNGRTTRVPVEPVKPAVSKGAESVITELSKTPQKTASSQHKDCSPLGLLTAPPGWQSGQLPKYSESLTVYFQSRRSVKSLGLLMPEYQPARVPNMPHGWSNINFAKPVTTCYVRVLVVSSCGDPQLLTHRGLRSG